MRISTLIGYVLVLGVIIAAMMFGARISDIMYFADVPSFLIVFGGALGLILAAKGAPGSGVRSKLRSWQLMTCALFLMAVTGDMIGGILVLANVKDPNTIGPSMAVCLLTSLYGLIAVLLISGPSEDRLVKSANAGSGFSLSYLVWFLFPVYSVMFAMIAFFMLLYSVSGSAA